MITTYPVDDLPNIWVRPDSLREVIISRQDDGNTVTLSYALGPGSGRIVAVSKSVMPVIFPRDWGAVVIAQNIEDAVIYFFLNGPEVPMNAEAQP